MKNARKLSPQTHTHTLWRWVEIDVCHHSLKVLAISWGRNIFKQQLMLKWDGFKRLKLSVPFAFSNNLSRESPFAYKSKTSNLFSQKIHFLPLSHIKKKPHKSGMINKFCRRRRICGNKWWSSERAYWECQVFV